MQLTSLATPLAFALCLAACASDTQPEQPPAASASSAPEAAPAPAPAAAEPSAQEPDDEDEITGKSLYARHCAGCHNDNGDGRGATMLAQGKQARSFAQGGFAFGNTPDAIAKTITTGIPGSSLMPPFQGLMDEDERRMVAEHVLTLTPYGNPKLASGSILVVKERAVIARGKLPPLHEGLPERPRGLLVGLPRGISFEYRTDDVRLLAVRRGGFADRTDWNDRGGGELKPLGEIVWELEGGDPAPWLSVFEAGVMQPIALELSATRTAGDGGSAAQIESTPKAGTVRGLRAVTETLFQPSLSEPMSYGRTLVLERTAGNPALVLTVASWPHDSLVRGAHLGNPVAPLAERAQEAWMVVKHAEGFDCIHVANPNRGMWGGQDPDHVMLLGDPATTNDPFTVTVVTVRVPAWDEALLARLSKELAR